MRRVRIDKAGGYERLRVEDAPSRAPRSGEVRVKVAAAGVNFADCIVRMGLYESAKKYVGWPITPGFEVAGHVDAVGAGVSNVKEGDRVLAVTRFDGYASEVVVPAHQVFAVPERWSLAEAAGFPAVFLTAYYALFELAHPREGSLVLVHSAAGGVGSSLLQLCRVIGARATGVVGRTAKVETARAMGAEHVVDKSAEPLWPTVERIAPGGFDVVLDANGPETLRASYKHLRPTGKLVVYGFHTMFRSGSGRPNPWKLVTGFLRTPRFSPLALTGDNKSVMAFNLSFLFEETALFQRAMTDLFRWSAEGKITPLPVRTFPFEAVADAHRAIESGETVGKLVLVLE
jgi:NADPH:quinone reductase-like Zn-dependent oxidoreductase